MFRQLDSTLFGFAFTRFFEEGKSSSFASILRIRKVIRIRKTNWKLIGLALTWSLVVTWCARVCIPSFEICNTGFALLDFTRRCSRTWKWQNRLAVHGMDVCCTKYLYNRESEEKNTCDSGSGSSVHPHHAGILSNAKPRASVCTRAL